MPDPDETTRLALEVYGWLARHPFPEHPPDLGFVFRLVGIRLGSEQGREVYDRVLQRLEIEEEHRKRTAGETPAPPVAD
jgi:hypothetical protein